MSLNLKVSQLPVFSDALQICHLLDHLIQRTSETSFQVGLLTGIVLHANDTETRQCILADMMEHGSLTSYEWLCFERIIEKVLDHYSFEKYI
jgi:hypothetical protein